MTDRAIASEAQAIAHETLHAQASRGERIVAYGRGAIWCLMGALIMSGAAGMERMAGGGMAIVLGIGLFGVGVASLMYARWLRPERFRRSFAVVTVSIDLGISLVALIVTATGTSSLVVREALGTTPTVFLLVFGIAAVALRLDPRLSALATAWAVLHCLAFAVYCGVYLDRDGIPDLFLTDVTPLWVVRATLVGLTGVVLVVAVRNARAMVHRTSAEVAERARVMRVFGRYVAPEIRDAVVLGEADAATVDVTVVFTDLRDFTSLAESVTPHELMALLNRHFAVLVPVVQKHGGTVNKFVGDALMATFGAPVPSERHAAAAVAAAREMVTAMAALNAELAAEGRPALRMGVGVATGPAVVGTLGSGERAEYAVLGDTVNTAARLEGLTKDLAVSVVVSEATATALGDEPGVRDLGPVRVKGKEQPVRVFAI